MSQFYTEKEREALYAELEDLLKNPDAGIALPKGTTLFVAPEGTTLFVTPPAAEQQDAIRQKVGELDLALKFALCNWDHEGTRRDVKKAQVILDELRALLAGGGK